LGVSWWHWRHLNGYLVLWFGLVTSLGMPAVMFGLMTAGELTALIGAITPVFVALCALAGYVAGDTTARKVAAVTGAAPDGLASTVVKAITGKR